VAPRYRREPDSRCGNSSGPETGRIPLGWGDSRQAEGFHAFFAKRLLKGRDMTREPYPELSWFVVLALLFLLASHGYLAWYVIFDNLTNHTGIALEFLFLFDLLSVLVVLWLLIFKRNEPELRVYRKKLLLVLMLSVICLTFLVILDICNLMMSYDRWIGKGMQDKSFRKR
jgi:hypothetical protein